jgi:hypothetical protein
VEDIWMTIECLQMCPDGEALARCILGACFISFVPAKVIYPHHA